MASGNDGRGGNTSYALTIREKKTLTEFRSYAKECETKITEDKANFAEKSSFGLWWDAKGLFNCSDVAEVTPHMEKYEKMYEEIGGLSAGVEKGDQGSYDKLLAVYEDLEELEGDAESEVKNNTSKTVCRMLREFLDKKYHLDHNLKKVECVVLRQKMHAVEQDCKRAKDEVIQMSEKMDKLIDDNRAARLESDERLSKLIEENRGIKEIVDIVRREKEEAERRSEAVRLESEERLKRVLEESEERSEARLQEMREEAERYRLEAERIRLESDERLKQAVDEANRRSEARMQVMAEQNRANLQKMMKMLEKMNIP